MRDAAAKHFRFPRGGGNLVALQLPDHLQRAVYAM